MPRGVTVFLPPKIANNFEAMVKIQRDLFTRLGHPACFSGRDFHFHHIVDDMFVARENGALDHIPGPQGLEGIGR